MSGKDLRTQGREQKQADTGRAKGEFPIFYGLGSVLVLPYKGWRAGMENLLVSITLHWAWGAWGGRSVARPTLDFGPGQDLPVHGIKPCAGPFGDSTEPA